MQCYRARSIIWLAILIVIAGLKLPATANSSDQPAALRIDRITPAGKDVPAGRQIVFQFDRAVVPVGRMERNAAEIPITISPGLDCQWRWLNTSALACQLDEKSSLSPATHYRITVNPGIKSEDGATLAKSMRHDFTTERPAVRHAWFKTWEAPGRPLIRMTFNQPVSQASVADHVFMLVAASKGRGRLDLKNGQGPLVRWQTARSAGLVERQRLAGPVGNGLADGQQGPVIRRGP